ncbi:nucleolar and coiled-body phosphoprotein 1 isoform X2 [Centropristis striata]|uniref:nucleolar and coiled-body phosphoprotein 1 isoform X2 n=1 Tax=Centropristis striata TaxID=184440 RepID=UPI0027DF1A5F|nr:nucleolar and coiled-body phosphoprotein 1 isoform X2 [Centropristis striata]
METKYPTLKRPKRKLCYLANKEGQPESWTGPQAVLDIDKMFDDLDSPFNNNGRLSPPSPLLQTFDIETSQREKEPSPIPHKGHPPEKGPKGDVLHPANGTPSQVSKLDLVADLDIPFRVHGPVKTSSPIEEKLDVEHVEEHEVVSPVLFACEDEGTEEAKTEALPIQEPNCNGHVTQEDDSELESPPSRVALSKPTMSSHKKEVEGTCKESHTVKEKPPNKPQTPVLKSKQKTPRKVIEDPPVPAVRQESEDSAPQGITENVPRQPTVESTRAGKDMTAFLKKLRDAGQPKPACSRKSLSPVKVPTPPPEPEDNFLIMEDDSPLWFSIPSKTATSKKQKPSKSSSTDKDSSTDNGKKDGRLETAAQKKQESEQTESKPGSQTVTEKTRKMRGKAKKNEVTEPGNDKDQLSSPEGVPAGDLMEEEKLNKKKQHLKKVPSKESDKEEEQPKDSASTETAEENPILKTTKKAQKSSDIKKSKTLKGGNENAKTGRAKSLKGGRKVVQEADAVKDTIGDEAGKEQNQSSEQHADAEDVGSHSDKELMNSEAPPENNSEESSPEDIQIVGKRKRRVPGQWWLDHQTSLETQVTDNEPTLKKSKQNNKVPQAAAAAAAAQSPMKAKKDREASMSPVKAKKNRAAAASPLKGKKDRVLKKTNQRKPAPSPRKTTNKTKEKKTKQNKNINTRGDTPDKVFHTAETEQVEELLQEVPDQDLDLQSSPLVFSHRDHSHDSGKQIFQKVYHHIPNDKLSSTPAPAFPREPRGQLRAAEPEGRRRKPPGNWWEVDKGEESTSSQHQQQEPTPRKERKMLSKQTRSPRLGSPKNGNMAVSPKPPGGAPVPRLKLKPLSAPKTVKRSLATFKDIFSSVTESPAVVSSRGNGRRKVMSRPAVEVTVTDRAALSQTGEQIHGMEAGEHSSTQYNTSNHESPQDSRFQSEDRLKLFSGPSSMIELQQYEEDEDLIPPPSRSPAALSLSDLCAPPLEPLVLQPKDKASLREWLNSLWPPSADKRAEITPDQFDWYFHQGRAIGFQVDLNCGSFCNGKILLGSYMKKPLWVDHSATTVFNLLTSTVSVSIDSKKSSFNPGQSFMVPCGHAYSIQNISSQPAVLCFTRMLAECTD